MIVTADQLMLHGIGDYCLQSDWQANNKTKAHFPAFCHALTYSLPFLLLTQSPVAWLTIFGTHFLIDRYRLARYVCWAKNWLGAPEVWHKYTAAPSGEWIRGKCRNPANGDHVTQMLINPPWPECANSFGYPSDRPAWLAMWLMVACDNLMHLCINAAAIRWL